MLAGLHFRRQQPGKNMVFTAKTEPHLSSTDPKDTPGTTVICDGLSTTLVPTILHELVTALVFSAF
jgi:hypothetical protein